MMILKMIEYEHNREYNVKKGVKISCEMFDTKIFSETNHFDSS